MDIEYVNNLWPALGAGFDALQQRASIFLDPASPYRWPQGHPATGIWADLARAVASYAPTWRSRWAAENRRVCTGYMGIPVPCPPDQRIAVAGAYATLDNAMTGLERATLSETRARSYINQIGGEVVSYPAPPGSEVELLDVLKWGAIAVAGLAALGLFDRIRGARS